MICEVELMMYLKEREPRRGMYRSKTLGNEMGITGARIGQLMRYLHVFGVVKPYNPKHWEIDYYRLSCVLLDIYTGEFEG